MANVKISGLPVAASAAGTDLFAIVQGGITKQLTNTLLFTSPTFVTPALGTPASGNLVNCLGYSGANLSGTVAVANGGTGLTTPGTSGNVLTSNGAGAWVSSAPAGGGVASVTGTAPVVSSGGPNPAISMAAATTSVNGYLTSTDWTTFNGKQAALVSGTNIKTVGGVSLLGAGDAGTIGAGYGGTGLTAPGANGNVLTSNGTAWTSSAPSGGGVTLATVFAIAAAL